MGNDEIKSEQEKDSAPELTSEKAATARRRIVIVGGGQTGRAMVRNLSEAWQVSVLDVDPTKLEKLREEIPNRSMLLLAKDGTSLLNLREAGVEGAEWLVALTDFDEANIEACRLARSVEQPPSAAGIVRMPQGVEKLRAVGAEAFARPSAIAGLVANHVEKAQQVAVNVGLGKGEIVEIPVLPSSPAVDTRVRDLRAMHWLVAAIYREDKFIFPHAHAVIRQGDRLLLTGEPEMLPHIADYLRAGVARFPLQYGIRIAALPGVRTTDRYWSEVEFLCNQTRTRAIRVLAAKGTGGPRLELLRAELEEDVVDEENEATDLLLKDLHSLDCGCVVLEKLRPSLLNRVGLTRPPFAGLLDRLPCPVLLSAGTHPYRRIWLPVTDSDGSMLAAELALDLSRQLDLQITALVVTPPSFIVGEDIVEEQKEAFRKVMQVASLYHVKLEQVCKEGNPGIEIARLAGEGDLLVISHRADRRPSFFNPDTSLQIISRCPCSVLALSFRERVHGDGAR